MQSRLHLAVSMQRYPTNGEERNYLQEKYDDCLCANCMKELKAEFHNNAFKQILKRLFGIFSQNIKNKS